jgi:predicted Holliday junction resolvase-like endonuclease
MYEILFAVLFLLFFALYIWQKTKTELLKKKHEQEIQDARKDAIKRSRASLEGQIYEQLIPYFPQWKFVPSDARFIGDPVDFLVIDGMSDGAPKRIVIVEVKKGSSSTTVMQNKIKKLIKDGKVEWKVIKVE